MGPEKGGQIQDQTKSQRRLLQREIPLPPIRRFVRRAASFWSATFALLFLITGCLIIWSFAWALHINSAMDQGSISGGFITGRIYFVNLQLIGSSDAYQLLCEQRPYMKPNERDGQFQVLELRGDVTPRKGSFIPRIQNSSFKVYHNNCEHADGAECLLNGTFFRERSISIPAIYFNLLFLFLAIIFARRNYRRTRPGCCRRCGYSMIGNESGVCPECGSDKGANPMDDAVTPSL